MNKWIKRTRNKQLEQHGEILGFHCTLVNDVGVSIECECEQGCPKMMSYLEERRGEYIDQTTKVRTHT